MSVVSGHMVYENKVNRRDELLQQVFCAVRHISDTTVLCKVMLSVVSVSHDVRPR